MKNTMFVLFWSILISLLPSSGVAQKSAVVAWKDLKECLNHPLISQPNIAVWDGDVSSNVAVNLDILNAIIGVAPSGSVVRALSDFERGKDFRLQMPEKQARQERIDARNFFRRDATVSLLFHKTTSSDAYRTWQITAKQHFTNGYESLCASSITICENGQKIADDCEALKVNNCSANQNCLEINLLIQPASRDESDLHFEVLCKDDVCVDRNALLYCGIHLPSWNNYYMALFPNSFSDAHMGKVPNTSVKINRTTTKFPQAKFGWLSGLQIPNSMIRDASLLCWLTEGSNKGIDPWSKLSSFSGLSPSQKNQIRQSTDRHDNESMLVVPFDYAEPILEEQEQIWSQSMLGNVKILLDR